MFFICDFYLISFFLYNPFSKKSQFLILQVSGCEIPNFSFFILFVMTVDSWQLKIRGLQYAKKVKKKVIYIYNIYIIYINKKYLHLFCSSKGAVFLLSTVNCHQVVRSDSNGAFSYSHLSSVIKWTLFKILHSLRDDRWQMTV